MEQAIETRVLRLVGLGVRSGGAIVGVERVREAAKSGKLRLALVASNASGHSVAKVVPLLKARHVRVLHVPSAQALGQAVGREQTAAIGIVDVELARGIRALVDSAPDRSQGEAD